MKQVQVQVRDDEGSDVVSIEDGIRLTKEVPGECYVGFSDGTLLKLSPEETLVPVAEEESEEEIVWRIVKVFGGLAESVEIIEADLAAGERSDRARLSGDLFTWAVVTNSDGFGQSE